MATADLLDPGVLSESTDWTLLELVDRFGPMPLVRLRHNRIFGAATEGDVLRLETDQPKILCELIDGVLLEKAMGNVESLLAMRLGGRLTIHVDDRRLGIVLGPDGMLRFPGDKIYIPDLSFLSHERLPVGGLSREVPISSIVPDLAVEVLSPSNTRREIEAKLQAYFAAGVRAVWIVDPASRTIRIHSGPDSSRTLSVGDTLDGAPVLPEFRISVDALFQGV